MEKEGQVKVALEVRAGEGALTNPAVHDIGLNDGAFPAEVLCHRGTAHLQVFHLQDGSPHLKPLNLTLSPMRIQPDTLPISTPIPGHFTQGLVSRQTAPSPLASISPAVSRPVSETAQLPPHLTALPAEGAGPEDC